MSTAFDPVSGRPTGSAPTAGARRGKSLPTGSVPGRNRPTKAARRDKGTSTGGRGGWLVVLGLVIGLGLIGLALVPRGGNGSEAAAGPTTTATTASTTSTATAAPTTTTVPTTTATTTGSGSADGSRSIPVQPADGGDAQLAYDVPAQWTSMNQMAFTADSDDSEAYAVLRSASTITTTTCTTFPIAAGVYFDDTTGPSVAQATKYAKGVATVAFGVPYDTHPTVSVTASRHIDGEGWMGREIVVHAQLNSPLGCDDTHGGTVALLALATDADPHHTIMIAAYSGTDSQDSVDEATLRKIVESVHKA